MLLGHIPLSWSDTHHRDACTDRKYKDAIVISFYQHTGHTPLAAVIVISGACCAMAIVKIKLEQPVTACAIVSWRLEQRARISGSTTRLHSLNMLKDLRLIWLDPVCKHNASPSLNLFQALSCQACLLSLRAPTLFGTAFLMYDARIGEDRHRGAAIPGVV